MFALLDSAIIWQKQDVELGLQGPNPLAMVGNLPEHIAEASSTLKDIPYVDGYHMPTGIAPGLPTSGHWLNVKMVFGRIPQSSYYDSVSNRPTAALYRARQPYLIKNSLTGVAIVGFVGFVYTWTIKAVGQDDFSDIPMPDKPVEPGHAPHMSTAKSAGSAQA